MLPRAHRLGRSAEFSQVVRRGLRSSSGSLVLHQLVRVDRDPVRVGVVVGRVVGDAPRRNRVKRQLRHLMGSRLTELDPHTSLVVRATKDAGASTGAVLAVELDRCLARLAERRAGGQV